MDMSGHAILKIVKGVQKVPGDSLSAEVGLDEIDLLDPNGFACDEYDMKLPALKSSAVYADSPLSDGRTLISGTLGNVTETIRLQLTAGTIIQMAAMLSKLGRFKQDCNDFWDTFGQIEPVYIKHQVIGEPGPRYALLYDIDIDPGQQPLIPSEAKRTVTLSIEREDGWRGLAPGDNPKRWAIENVFDNQKFNNNNAGLLLGNDFLFMDNNVENRAEQNTTQTGYAVKNFVDIPAASIPGDLPALLCLSYSKSGSSSATSLFVSKTTRKDTGNISRTSGTNQYLIHVFNAADASMGTDTTLAADTGASTGISGLQRRSQTTFATATLITRLTWSETVYSANGFNLSVLRGRYAVFCRARLSASATTVQLQLGIDEAGSTTNVLDPVTFTHEGVPSGTGNTTFWGLAYLGQITLPSTDRRTAVSPNGMGIAVKTSILPDISLLLLASRSAGAGVLYVNDLIFMPIDEGAINLISTGQGITSPSGGGVIYDNTGYMQHGRNDEYASLFTNTVANGSSEYDRVQLSGTPIYLTPNVSNRLEFLAYTDSTKRSAANVPTAVTVRASIVPRWAGLRSK